MWWHKRDAWGTCPSSQKKKVAKHIHFQQIFRFLPPQKCILPSWCSPSRCTLAKATARPTPRARHGTPLEKTTFPPESFKYLYTIYIYTNCNHISGKKYKIFVRFQNNQFSFCVILISAKIWKTAFPKEFFNEIWLKLGDHEYINIAEMKFG